MAETMEQLVKNGQDLGQTIEQLLNAPYGMQGASVITDTNQHTGDWYCIISIEDGTILGNIGDVKCNWDTNGVLTTPFTSAAPFGVNQLPIPTGVPLYGHFTQLALNTGKIVAYKR